MSVLPVCMSVHHTCARWLQKPEECIRYAGARVRYDHELPNMSTGNQTWVLCEKNKYSYTLSLLSRPRKYHLVSEDH